MSEAEAEARQHRAEVQKIEQATEHLDQTMDEAREAVQRAQRADSLASPGEEQTVPEADAEPAAAAGERGEDEERGEEGRR
jgi:hypothetical protein